MLAHTRWSPSPNVSYVAGAPIVVGVREELDAMLSPKYDALTVSTIPGGLPSVEYTTVGENMVALVAAKVEIDIQIDKLCTITFHHEYVFSVVCSCCVFRPSRSTLPCC